MKTSIANSLMAVCAVSALACDQGREVRDEVQDLKEAEERSPEVAQELRQELAETKEEVARLQEKLALAERGVTDEVIEERRELKEAVKDNQQEVAEEVKEAQRAAARHNTGVQQAKTQLERTRAPEVEAQVNTETTVKPGSTNVEMQQQRREIETKKMVEQPSQQQQ